MGGGVPLLGPDFLSHIVKENQAITIYQPTMSEGKGISRKSVLGSWKSIKTIFIQVRYLFSFFKIYSHPPPFTLKSFTLLDTDQNRSNSVNRFSLAAVD